MRQLILIITYLISILPHPLYAAWGSSPLFQGNTGSNSFIEAPISGQAVQGSVVILGSTEQDGFFSYEVDFSYVKDLTQVWFLVQESTTPVQDGILAVWDTTTITDGEYSLRLFVTKVDGTHTEVLVEDLRVRNYTLMETSTPTPIPPTSVPGKPFISPTPAITSKPTPTSQPSTPTSLPTNPVEITSSQLVVTYGKGAAFAIGFFALLGIYLGIRTMQRNRK
jgi:hypothetical protein